MKIKEIICEIGSLPPAPAGIATNVSSDAPFSPLGGDGEPDNRELRNRKTMKDADMSPFTKTRVKTNLADVNEIDEEELPSNEN